MTFVVKGVAVAAVLGLAACAPPPRPVAQDTGSMAFPAPVPAGNLSTTRPGAMAPSADTGSMAAPAGRGGSLRAAPNTPDTGSMAIPENSMGNLRRPPASR